MADYEHSSNYHKVIAKIQEISNLKDLEVLKRKLESLEMDSEVQELLKKCDERRSELKDLIKEEKYQKALAEYENPDADIDSLIGLLKDIGDYKDANERIEALTIEKKYRSLIRSFESGKSLSWEGMASEFEKLGDYKRSKEYHDKCLPRIEEEKKAKELKEAKEEELRLEKIYQEASELMDKEVYKFAAEKFAELGDFKDSKQRSEKCNKILADKDAFEKRRKRTIMLIILAVFVFAIAVYVIISMTKWAADDSGHWHSIAGSPVGFSTHDYSLVEEENPTCVNEGHRTYTCNTCGWVFTEHISATGHTSDSGIVTKEPSCTARGTKTYTCKICGEIVKSEMIPATGHAIDNGRVTKEPTCNEAGIKTYTCTTCGEVIKTETIEMKPHSYVESIKIQPQCETRGLAEATCSVCGDTTVRTLDASGHDWILEKRVEPTCTDEGVEYYSCNTCNKTKTESIPANGHNWVVVKEVDPMCVSAGYIEYRCSVCKAYFREATASKGHNYFDGICLDCGFDSNQFHLGDIGPAGGYIFYDCDSDNETGNGDGLKSSECKWRFLEAAPEDLRVVNGVPTVDSSRSGYSNADTGYVFGYYRKSDSGINLYVNGTTAYSASNCTGTAVGTGRSNTEKLVSMMGASTYSDNSGSAKTGNYAARLCDILEYTVDGVTYDDWFLPSKDELKLMYTNLDKAGLGGFVNYYYWSSSESNYSANYAWFQVFGNGNQGDYSRYPNYRVRPVRAF